MPRDPELAAAVASARRFSRRRFLAGSGLGLGAAALAPGLLASCAVTKDQLTFSNWTQYIDEDDNGNNRAPGTTISDFEHETGIKINYLTDFNDNDEYFNRSFSPMLGRGKPINADIVAPTYWMAARLVELGWTEQLDLTNIPNHRYLEDAYLGLPWNPRADRFMPWQAGIAGIAYNHDVVGRELTSANDLYDPEFRGQVTMLTEMRDTVGLTMFGMGFDPADADPDEIDQALDKVQQARDDGQILKFTGNDYLQDLGRGDVAVAVGWSGDIYSFETDADLRFVVPEEGGMQWFDAMVVPKGATYKAEAEEWMNFVYDPENAARITEWVGYLSPVKGVREILLEGGEDSVAIAEDPLVFPDEETQARLRVFGPLDQADEIAIQTRFNDITG
jgi:spermidine/putrescine transport system substrate-binding protein